jgi:hypothetical protein
LKPEANPASEVLPPALPASSRRLGRATLIAGLALVALSLVPIAATVGNTTVGDIYVYERVAEMMHAGKTPYRDWSFEYPPYTIPAFLAPAKLQLPWGYVTTFALEMLLLDLLVKVLLLVEGRRSFRGWLGLLPLAVFALGGWVQQSIYLKRFDLLPATLVVLAVLAFARARPRASGLTLALAAGVKVYPLVLVPVLAAAALRRKELGRFTVGLALGAAPLAVLALAMPWWQAMTLQAGRQLQVESLVASVIWLLHLTTGLEAHWSWINAWYDITGPAAQALVLPVKALFGAIVLLSTASAAWRAWKAPPQSASALAALLLLPLVAFVGFANVLSPQYVIWYWALLALAAPAVHPATLLILAATAPLTSLFYPSPQYDSAMGLELWRAVALVLRNLALVAGWAMLYFGHGDRHRSLDGSPASAA